jgi:2-dehydropantoate 2-reductase
MRFAIYGTGGVGGYFGGRLAEAGHDVGFIARGENLEAIRRDGLVVESVDGDFTIQPARVSESPAEIGPVDAVLVCVKTWQVPDAAAHLAPMLGPDTFVVPLQNGVEAADQLAAVVGAGRVVGGLCRILSFVAGPGRIRHAGVQPVIEFGERDGKKSARVDAVAAAFESTKGIKVRRPASIEVATWDKLMFIAPFGAVGAVTRMPAGVIRAVPETRALLRDAMAEVGAVAAARGVVLATDVVDRTVGYIDGLPAESTASMQRDILEGRPSELEQQTGVVVRFGRAANVAVPVNTALYRSLLPAELRARGQLPA